MIWTAVLIGLAGSLHCVGMCSPLAIAVSGLSPTVLLNRTLYNVGRVLVYGALGAAVGAFGALAGLTDYQTLLSAGLGLLLVLLGFSGVSVIRIPGITLLLQRFTLWLKVRFASSVRAKTWWSLLLMGGINGLLPCGLTYFALTYCITLPDAMQGFLFMTAFGVGTLPVMVGLTAFLQWLTARLKWRIQRISAIIMIALGALLLVRSAYFVQHHSGAAQQAEVVCP